MPVCGLSEAARDFCLASVCTTGNGGPEVAALSPLGGLRKAKRSGLPCQVAVARKEPCEVVLFNFYGPADGSWQAKPVSGGNGRYRAEAVLLAPTAPHSCFVLFAHVETSVRLGLGVLLGLKRRQSLKGRQTRTRQGGATRRPKGKQSEVSCGHFLKRLGSSATRATSISASARRGPRPNWHSRLDSLFRPSGRRLANGVRNCSDKVVSSLRTPSSRRSQTF